MLTRKNALRIYRDVLCIRRCEERICREYFKDEMKTPVHLGIGAEGIDAGALAALPPGTKVFGTYRNHGLYLSLTGDFAGFFAELFGKVSGTASGKAGSMHLTHPAKGLYLTSAVVATPIPVAVGAALAHRYRGENDPVAVFFGDGAVEEGAFWESLNFACLKKLRVFFICEDNGLAIHAMTPDRQGFRNIPEAVRGFDCHIMSREGYDPALVYADVLEGIQKTESDPQPCFFHFQYLRYKEHVGVKEDFDAGYRAQPSPEELIAKDPLGHAVRVALEAGVSQDEINNIGREIDRSIDEAVAGARQAPYPTAESLYRGV